MFDEILKDRKMIKYSINQEHGENLLKHEIIKHLEKIENDENVKILYAAESGSRAWGFASPDSDYDVRFIYLRNKDFYLKLEKTRDVIELPVDEVLDINGWDLQKALRLLHTSNPTLFEWSNSTIVYKTTPYFESLKKIINNYFKAKSGLYHYLSTAAGNYREYLKSEMVRSKKYFYVVRPILACKWILKENTPPPMLFSQLVESCLEDELKSIVNNLLEMKQSLPEIGQIPKIIELNEYIEKNLAELKEQIDTIPNNYQNSYHELNKLFILALEER